MMHATATLGYRDGWLCAVETQVRSTEPMQDTLYWPLLKAVRAHWEEDLGKPLYRETSTCYSMKIGGYWRAFHLSEGGQTHAVCVESQPVPKPARVRSELRWKWGKWEKHHTKHGWIPA